MADKILQDKIVSAIKTIAADLGRPPSRKEFTEKSGVTQGNMVSAFGLWSEAVRAAGFEPIAPTKKTQIKLIDDPAIVKDTIEKTTQRKIVSLNSYKKILCIGDVHEPFSDAAAMSMVYALIEKEKPDIVVQMGDLFDFYAQSRFPKSLNIYTPKAEWDLARAGAVSMWGKIRSIAPHAELFQIMGNHCIRPIKRAEETAPSITHLIEEKVAEAYTFDGVTTIHSPYEELFIQDIAFIHGHYTGIGKHRDYMRMNVVHGHTHKGGVSYRPTWNEKLQVKTIWELDCGLVGDPFSKALFYRSQRIHDWTLGCGLVDSMGPRFIAF
jgi:UDP-2,3-diacylglucosamine pyrophosphatase LpxH